MVFPEAFLSQTAAPLMVGAPWVRVQVAEWVGHSFPDSSSSKAHYKTHLIAFPITLVAEESVYLPKGLAAW